MKQEIQVQPQLRSVPVGLTDEVKSKLNGEVQPLKPLSSEAAIPIAQLHEEQAKLFADLNINTSTVENIVREVQAFTFFTEELGSKQHVINAIGREDTIAVARLNKELQVVQQMLSIQKYLSYENEWDKRWYKRTVTTRDKADEWGIIPKVGQYIPAEQWSIFEEAFHVLFKLDKI